MPRASPLADAAVTDAIVKVAVLTGMIVLILTTWLVAGTWIGPLLRDRHRARFVNAVLALALLGATAFAVFR